MGKFLYNKRIDPKAKGEPRQMTAKELLSGKTKPKFYENHKQLLH